MSGHTKNQFVLYQYHTFIKEKYCKSQKVNIKLNKGKQSEDIRMKSSSKKLKVLLEVFKNVQINYMNQSNIGFLRYFKLAQTALEHVKTELMVAQHEIKNLSR
eukprot:NODE_161_length_16629_cov_0.427344.p12 type:complete len:103 gc:universal NODE_161_length_16629_cov_0.427344:8232-7924(-)